MKIAIEAFAKNRPTTEKSTIPIEFSVLQTTEPQNWCRRYAIDATNFDSRLILAISRKARTKNKRKDKTPSPYQLQSL